MHASLSCMRDHLSAHTKVVVHLPVAAEYEVKTGTPGVLMIPVSEVAGLATMLGVEEQDGAWDFGEYVMRKTVGVGGKKTAGA